MGVMFEPESALPLADWVSLGRSSPLPIPYFSHLYTTYVLFPTIQPDVGMTSSKLMFNKYLWKEDLGSLSVGCNNCIS